MCPINEVEPYRSLWPVTFIRENNIWLRLLPSGERIQQKPTEYLHASEHYSFEVKQSKMFEL